MNKLFSIKAAGIASIASIILLPTYFVFAIASEQYAQSWVYKGFDIFFNLLFLAIAFIFVIGFNVIADKYNNLLLKVLNYIGLAFSSVVTVLSILNIIFNDYISNYIDGLDSALLMIIGSICLLFLGAYFIVYGVSLMKLKNIAPMAKSAAVLNIISGACMISIIFSFFSLVLLIPIAIMEALVAFKIAKFYSQELTQDIEKKEVVA